MQLKILQHHNYYSYISSAFHVLLRSLQRNDNSSTRAVTPILIKEETNMDKIEQIQTTSSSSSNVQTLANVLNYLDRGATTQTTEGEDGIAPPRKSRGKIIKKKF